MDNGARRIGRWLERLAVLATVAAWLVVAQVADHALKQRDAAPPQPEAVSAVAAAAETVDAARP